MSWFTFKDITNNNFTNDSGDNFNKNPLSHDLFKGIYFIDKQTTIDTMQASHIIFFRNYHVFKSDITRYEAKYVIDECLWKIHIVKWKRSGHLEITKFPAGYNCLIGTLKRDHQRLS